MEHLVMFAFKYLDSDGDSQLSVDEVLEGSKNSDVISRMADLFHALFPLRGTPQEMEEFVQAAVTYIGGGNLDKESVGRHTAWLDDDGDGLIQLEEARKGYNVASKQFLDTAQTLKLMGPTMAMIGEMQSQSKGAGVGGDPKTEL